MMSDHPQNFLYQNLKKYLFPILLGKEKIQYYKNKFGHLKTQTAKIMSLYLKGWIVSIHLYKTLNKNVRITSPIG